MAASTSSSLSHFWDLASPAKDKRLSSSSQLVAQLVRQQSALASTSRTTLDQPSYPALSAREGLDAVSEEQEQFVEGKIDQMLASDVSYSLRRLVRGLASPREHSRMGFAVALSEVLRNTAELNADDVLTLIIKHSRATGRVSRTEQRNLLFARLFGIQALLRSGMLLARKDSTISQVRRVLEVLTDVGIKKPWLKESCGWTLIEILEQLTDVKDPFLAQAVSEQLREYASSSPLSAEKLALLLSLRKNNLAGAASENQKKKTDFVAGVSLQTASKVLVNASPVEKSEDDEDVPDVSGSHNPTVHFVWDVLLDAYFGEGTKPPSISFAELYVACVDDTLFAATASPERKSWGFQIFCKALPMVSPSDKPLLFTPNFMRTWINHLASKDRLLHSAASNAAVLVQTTVSGNPDVGFALVSQLLGKNGNQNFDRITNTKTVENILSAMDANGVRRYAKSLADLIALATEDTKRKWALDQLHVLIRNTAIPTDDDCSEDILKYLLAGAFFAWRSAPSSGLLSSQPKPAFSEEVRSQCSSRLLSCLAELSERTVPVTGADRKARRVQGVDSQGRFWMTRAWSLFEGLNKDSKHFSKILGDDVQKTLTVGQALLESVKKARKTSTAERVEAFEFLLTASLFYVAESSAEGADLVEQLQDCHKRLLTEDATTSTAAMDIDGDDDEREPSGIELLQDYLIGLLEQPSAFLRIVAQQAFGAFAGEMNRESLDHLIDQLGLNEEPEGEGDDEEGDDGAEDDEISEDETSATSADSDSDDDDNEEDVDETLRNDVYEALKAGGMADDDDADSDASSSASAGDKDDDSSSSSDGDDESLTDLTDDQMLQIDDKLAEIFRLRLKSKRNDKEVKHEAAAFQNKVLDLLSAYAKKHSSNPLVLRLVNPLFVLATEQGKNERQVAQKAAGILRTVCKATLGETDEPTQAEAMEDLKAVHAYVCSSTDKETASLASTVNIFLTRVLLGPDSSSETSAPSPPPAAVTTLYESTLKEYLSRSACQLRPAFLGDAFRRLPQLGWSLSQLLLDGFSPKSASSVKAFRQQQAMQMLQVVLQGVASKSSHAIKPDAVLSFVHRVADVVFSTVHLAVSPRDGGADLKADRVKEVLKFGLQCTRLTARLASAATRTSGPANEVVQTIWKVSKLESCATALKGSDRFKDSTSLQSLLKQMIAVVKSSSSLSSSAAAVAGEGSNNKKRKGGTKGGDDDQEVKVNGFSGEGKEDDVDKDNDLEGYEEQKQKDKVKTKKSKSPRAVPSASAGVKKRRKS